MDHISPFSRSALSIPLCDLTQIIDTGLQVAMRSMAAVWSSRKRVRILLRALIFAYYVCRLLCRWSPLRLADHPFREVLPANLCVCVCVCVSLIVCNLETIQWGNLGKSCVITSREINIWFDNRTHSKAYSDDRLTLYRPRFIYQRYKYLTDQVIFRPFHTHIEWWLHIYDIIWNSSEYKVTLSFLCRMFRE